MRMKHFLHYVMLSIILSYGVFTPRIVSAEAGGIRLGQTRVIFNAEAKNAQMMIKNGSDQVYLLKADVMSTQEGNEQKSKPPFIITPPISRLEAKNQSTLLIVPQGTNVLPTDRESVFYLSLLAIPSTPKGKNAIESMTQAQVSVGIRNVIKLFYRPVKLPITVEQAAGKLVFHQTGQQVAITNPTPYFLTLAQLAVNQHFIDLQDVDPMIAPFSTSYYPIKGRVAQAEWAVITDFGDISPLYQATLHVGENHDKLSR